MSFLKINPTQAKQLKTIYDAGDIQFGKLHKALCNRERPSIRASSLFEQISSATGDPQLARAFCTQMISLATFRRTKQRDIEVVVDQFIEGLDHTDIGKEIYDWYFAKRQAFIELLKSDSIRMPAKALDLTTDQDTLFYAGNLVTDIRPVFDGDRDEIGGAIIVQSLKIHFYENGGRSNERVLSLAVDDDDIENLILELKKAKRKAEACRVFVEANGKSEAYIVGEENYEFS